MPASEHPARGATPASLDEQRYDATVPTQRDEYRDAMVRQGKCPIRITVEEWGPVATGGFPPRLDDSR